MLVIGYIYIYIEREREREREIYRYRGLNKVCICWKMIIFCASYIMSIYLYMHMIKEKKCDNINNN